VRVLKVEGKALRGQLLKLRAERLKLKRKDLAQAADRKELTVRMKALEAELVGTVCVCVCVCVCVSVCVCVCVCVRAFV
jgi:hypothetical protein